MRNGRSEEGVSVLEMLRGEERGGGVVDELWSISRRKRRGREREEKEISSSKGRGNEERRKAELRPLTSSNSSFINPFSAVVKLITPSGCRNSS